MSLLDRLVIQSDCIEHMVSMDEASVDAVVCDPPYGLEFMGASWDRLNGSNGFRRADNPADVGRDDVFGRTSARGPEYIAGRRAQEWHERWAREALRVLKPGGYLLSFGGTRTSHRLACAVEDVGFEIRDSIMWLYGSGFPKSLSVSKAIDKAARGVPQGGADPTSANHGRFKTQATEGLRGEGDLGRGYGAGPGQFMAEAGERVDRELVAEAERWSGYGTSLKPAHEPIIVARKPLIGTVVKNVLEHGTGALNIDGCRIGMGGDKTKGGCAGTNALHDGGIIKRASVDQSVGRWPANVVLSHHPDCESVGSRVVSGRTINRWDDGAKPFGGGAGHEFTSQQMEDDCVEVFECHPDCPVRMLDEQTGTLKSGTGNVKRATGVDRDGNTGAAYGAESRLSGTEMISYGDSGGASRFFATFNGRDGEASAERRYTEKGATNFAPMPGLRREAVSPSRFFYCSKSSSKERSAGLEGERNIHPTCKPVKLMCWLVRLVTPPNGLVLDPFCGSGTTGIAAVQEGFRFLGIEREAEYVSIARARIEHAARELAEKEVAVA